jgi:spermidine synthase
MRNLFHGVIVHGKESLDSGQRDRPTAYYCTSAGVGLAWRAMRRTGTGLRVGVVGLGAGTLAAYGEAGDTLRFYEINPLVVEIARSQFHFLGDTRATVEIALGDARLVLENEAPQQFDLLAIDAFSGDAVPVHLLTREAFAVYFRHIRPGGILAVHISNGYLNLEPVVASAAAALGKKALLADSVPSSADTLCLRAIWALVVEPPAAAQFPTLTAAQTWPHFRTWTDDYSSMFAVLRR